ncbi:uncharacterized protein KY384_001710 [Bacidia gigantensis]|uniref:uncharacterized protein n=1 Tax=Bacidia gigantensis TaxID=2732470 RepID=UPI001D03E704|nr:uncharacterized protein KY384_001710 [Bacidia gigantensis]KAG8533967.1 hypothetical protein KY384_001710 [Bacidia gigantensis]
MAQSYKSLKEEFVSGLKGGKVSEINYVTAIAPASYLLWSVLQARHDFFTSLDIRAFLADFLLQVVTILLSITLYSSIPIFFNILLLTIAVAAYLVSSTRRRFRKPSASAKENNSDKNPEDDLDTIPVRPFITAYRGGMIIITCLAILAVDFRVFPRRFAKVETWGTSLMDMGVGSFVFSAGLISARPILKASESPSIASQLKLSIRTSIPLLILGVIRLYSVKGLDYAEHVTEYGVHWNFFFTLALLAPAVALLKCLPMINYLSLYIVGFFINFGYTFLLDNTHVEIFILTAPRGPTFFSKNREGIFSFLGYLAIFITGQAVGVSILRRNTKMWFCADDALGRRVALLALLVITTVGYYNQYRVSTGQSKIAYKAEVSRRLANAPYIEWVVWFNCMQLLAYCAVETWIFPAVYKATTRNGEQRAVKKATSTVLKAFNRNGLAIFLVANLLTGVVNLSMDTLNASKTKAMFADSPIKFIQRFILGLVLYPKFIGPPSSLNKAAPMPFAINIGDIIALGNLIKDIIIALEDSKGSSAEYEECIRKLECLKRILREIEVLDDSLVNVTELHSLRQTIHCVIRQCQQYIDLFLDRIAKFDPSLRRGTSRKRKRDALRKLQWRVCRSKDLVKFRTEVNGYCSIFGVLLQITNMRLSELKEQNLHSRLATADDNALASTKEVLVLLNEVKNHLRDNTKQIQAGNAETSKAIGSLRTDWLSTVNVELKGLLKSIFLAAFATYKIAVDVRKGLSTHLERWVCQQPFLLIDAHERHMPIHMDTINSWGAFDAWLEYRFKAKSGDEMVQNRQYVLHNSDANVDIDRDIPFEKAISAGSKLVMCMTFFSDRLFSTDGCPVCDFLSVTLEDEDVHW